MPEQLFVYGSLMSGMENGGMLSRFPRREAELGGRLFRVPAGYPMLVPDPDGPPVRGELVTLPHAGILQVLDLFEGVGQGLYRRLKLEAWSAGSPQLAWVYAQDPGTVAERRYAPLKVQDWRLVGPRAAP